MNIVHTFLNKSSFVQKDAALFGRLGQVREFEFSVKKKLWLPLVFIRQFLFLLRTGWKADVFIHQFAGYHSFLPCLFARLTGKKSVIIAGGTDCVSFPGIRYGNFYRPLLRDFTRWSYQLCTHICPKHATLWYTDYTYDTTEPAAQGISAFLPRLKKQVRVITNGYDPAQWPLLELHRNPRSFITVSGAFEYPFQVQLKGIDLILQVAAQLPNCSFTIAGVPEWKKLDVQSANVTILPPVKHDELYKLFNQHTYYLQVSMAEGFPNALCEAMLCGCTPIVSNVFSMPEITGTAGHILMKRNPSLLYRLLQEALAQPGNPEQNRELIAQRYTEQLRQEQLSSLLRQISPS